VSALRTIKGGDLFLNFSDWVIVGLGTVLIPPMIGWGLGLTIQYFAAGAEVENTVLGLLMGVMIAQTVAIFFTVFATLPALLIGAWMLRLGWGGWVVAAAGPPLVIALVMTAVAFSNTGYQPQTYFAPAAIFSASGALHGAIMWSIARWRRPQAFAPRRKKAHHAI